MGITIAPLPPSYKATNSHSNLAMRTAMALSLGEGDEPTNNNTYHIITSSGLSGQHFISLSDVLCASLDLAHAMESCCFLSGFN